MKEGLFSLLYYISVIFIFSISCSAASSQQSAGTDSVKLQKNHAMEMTIKQLNNMDTPPLSSSPINPSLKKKHLIVATLESPPFVMKRSSSENNQTIEWYGYCIDFFHELIKHLPYEVTYEIYHVADNKFGSKVKQVVMETINASEQAVPKKLEYWNGLVGDLEKGKAHMALAPLAVMAERELVIDFTVPFYDLVGIQILLKKPEVPQDWFKFLTVLDNEVWFSITIAYFVTSFVIFLFDRLSPYSHKNLTRLRKLSERNRQDTTTNGQAKSTSLVSSIGVAPIRPLDANKYNFNHLQGSTQQPTRPLNFVSGATLLPPSSPDIALHSNTLFDTFNFESRNHEDAVKLDEPNAVGPFARARRLSADYWNTVKVRSGRVGVPWDDESDMSDSSDADDGKPDFGLRDSLWFCITSLTPQGGGEAPQNLSGRVVAGAWWLFCFIVIASYTANLAAFLTVSRLDIPIESLDDLAKQYRIKYAPVDGTAEQTYFERMAYIEEIFYNIWKEMSLNNSLNEDERSKFAVWDYPISDKYTKIWAQIQEVGMPSDIETGIKRVKNSNLDDGFALLADSNLVKHAVMTDCSFKAVGDEFSRKPVALGIRKGYDQLKDDISYAILQLINQRFMEVLREKWWTNNPMRINCVDDDESEGISIENIGGVFVIIVAGVVLSFFAWAVERFVYKTKIELSKGMIDDSKN